MAGDAHGEKTMSQTTMSDKMEVTRSDDEVYGLLAAANLLRTRKQTELALNKCMEVLRRQPDNGGAAVRSQEMSFATPDPDSLTGPETGC